jgi:MarR family 2-MHQ and catechol resistance regulon transcriptional repressor
LTASQGLIDAFRQIASSYSRYTTDSFFRFAKSNELSPSQLGTLLHLSKGEAHGIADVGDRMFVTSAAASQMIDRLVQAGMVERRVDEEDRRAKHIGLTDKGAKTIEEFGRERQAWIRELAKKLDEGETRILQSALEIVIEKSKDIRQGA